MHTPSRTRDQEKRRERRGCLVCLLMVLLLGGIGIYYLYFSPWGIYAVRRIPVPDHIMRDGVAAPSGGWSTERRNRIYDVQSSLQQVVSFYHRTLSQTRWVILDEGAFPAEENPGYCMVIKRWGIEVHLRMVESRAAGTTRVTIDVSDHVICNYVLGRSVD